MKNKKMDLYENIINGISKGINESLNYIEDLDDEDDFLLSKKSVSQSVKDVNDANGKKQLKRLYSKKLNDMLSDDTEADISDQLTLDFIKLAQEYHKEYGAVYNSGLDGDDFQFFMWRCIQLIGNDGDFNWIDTSAVTNMENLFADTRKFNGDISQWDVSHVQKMKNMFSDCAEFNGDISSWDVSSVENMESMFYRCIEFNQDISHWDVSNVVNMGGMFENCMLFDQDISSWNTKNVKDMGYMFHNCAVFCQDLSCWDVSNVSNTIKIFKNCPLMHDNDDFFPNFKR